MSQPATSVRPERRILQVSQVLAGLRRLFADRVGRIWVAGEVSNLFLSSAGHAYFTLQDDRARLRCVLFRGEAARLPFELEDGLEVITYAEASVYEARGDLQLIVKEVEPLGAGALQLAFEQLRRRLEAEGLFDAARKRPLPANPRRIGVVSSSQGAAVRDVIEVSGQRSPATPILLSHSRVQGEGAEDEIARALDRIGTRDEVDVVLVVRGGGSLEDLWAFNTEVVVRAIERCPVPVISGVGHETDLTLADLVADARAPTPSAAALLAVPDRSEQLRQFRSIASQLTPALRASLGQRRLALAHGLEALRAQSPALRLARGRTRLAQLAAALGDAAREQPRARRRRLDRAIAGLDPRKLGLEAVRLRLDSLGRRMPRAVATHAAAQRAALGEAIGRLDSLSPLAVLARGYAIARHADGHLVRTADDAAPGDRLRVRTASAELETEVLRVRAVPAGPAASVAATPEKR